MGTTDDYTARTTSLDARTERFGDYGNACMTAYGTSRWAAHIESCAHCAAVQRRWDAERAGKSA